MLTHLTYKAVIIAAAVVILAGFASVENELNDIRADMKAAIVTGTTVNQLAGAINESQLQPPAQYVTFLPKRKPVQIARQ